MSSKFSFCSDSIVSISFPNRDVLTYVVEDASNPSSIIVPPGDTYANLNAQEYLFRLHSVAHNSQEQPEAILAMDVKNRVEEIPGIGEADVEVVFDPPWNQNMMSEAARLQLGFF